MNNIEMYIEAYDKEANEWRFIPYDNGVCKGFVAYKKDKDAFGNCYFKKQYFTDEIGPEFIEVNIVDSQFPLKLLES